MFSPSMHFCQICLRLLRRGMISIITIKHPTNYVAALQQPLDYHKTSMRRMCSSLTPHLNLHSGQRSSQISIGRLGVGALRGLCESVTQHCQVKQHDCEEPEAKMLIPHKQGQAPSRKVPLTTLVDLEDIPRLSALEEISDEEAIQIVVPHALPPTSSSLRDYVDKSDTLTKLVQLGVDLWKLEQRRNVGSMLVRLDFQSDVAPRLLFLKDLGLQDGQLGSIITTNPFILTERLDKLKARVSYLKSKKFSTNSIASMVSKAPYLLNFNVKRLDNRLGFYQDTLGLNPEKTRDIITRLPRLLCGSLEPVKENLKVYELEFGFRTGEIQHMVTEVPKMLTANKTKLSKIFDYIHNTMGIPHSLIAKFPQVLNAQFLRIKERHLFLKYLGRAHYDPAEPNYVSLDRLVALPDDVFCTSVALATVDDFECFQKTL
ncbi:transcription termination factor 3, mitochondrial isoform X1 [Alosa pseudoharengus]|uniref:transcription termination factor 3, mitochondrial isoform X1 n=4 Tax=Alosa pseudoharengus TaxID=34774 RepID=UPI003F8C1231